MSQPTGRGRRALSMGADDPRARRGLAQPIGDGVGLAAPLYVDEAGRTALRAARAVARFEPATTPAEERLNDLIDSLRAAGLLET